MNEDYKILDEKDICCNFTKGIVCPWCGHEHWDCVEEDFEGDMSIQCAQCEKDFYAEQNISISYSTKRVSYGTCTNCGATNVVLNSCSDYPNTCKDVCEKCRDVITRRQWSTHLSSMNI